ncbi:hypothetical protein KKJ25_01130, partial [Xenorhabdus bovienii]|uniref:hypothetical protein n=1 Tax=Xenorhabdus bovienii TaxID=40576 RepID=UPI00237CCB19
MRIYRYAVLPIALKVALFFPGMSVNAIAASPCKTIISEDRTEPCNLSDGENLTIDKGVSIDIPQGPRDNSDNYGLKYNAVNIGGNNNMPPITSVDHIENNGILKGESGVTVRARAYFDQYSSKKNLCTIIITPAGFFKFI